MSTLAPPRDPQLPGSLPTCRLSSSYFASVSLTCERTTPHVPSSLPCFAAYQRSQLGQTQTVSRPAETANSASRGVAALHPLAHTSWRTCYLVGTHSGAKLGPSPCQRAWTGPCPAPPLHVGRRRHRVEVRASDSGPADVLDPLQSVDGTLDAYCQAGQRRSEGGDRAGLLRSPPSGGRSGRTDRTTSQSGPSVGIGLTATS